MEIIKKARKEMKRDYKERLGRLDWYEKFIEKINPVLPHGWILNVTNTPWLTITRYNNIVPAIEFRTVCDFVEKITRHKVQREAFHKDTLVGKLSFFQGTSWVTVRILAGSVDCEIKEEEVTEKQYVASPECLGIRKEETI